MPSTIPYEDLPKAIQNLVDGAEFLDRVEKRRIRQNRHTKTVYILVYRDSFEIWAKFYDGYGNSLGQTDFLPYERRS